MNEGGMIDNEIIIGDLIDNLANNIVNNAVLEKSKKSEKVKRKIIKKKDKDDTEKFKVKKKIKKKLDDDNFKIPTFDEYEYINEYEYRISHLKQICKYYKLKQSGNKTELSDRIYNYLKDSRNVIKLQAIWKGVLTRKWLKYHGPAWKKRDLCVNPQDFLTFDNICDLNIDQFFSFKDKDNFIYGFDIISIYNLIKQAKNDKKNNKILNPYNRDEISKEVLKNLTKLIHLSKIMKRDTSIEVPKEEEQDDETIIKNRIVNIFQNIDLLGHYTHSEWFKNLNVIQLKRFLKELCEIWCYRAQLSLITKINIYPPSGDPFSGIYGGSYSGLVSINTVSNLVELQKNSLTVMERMVNSGINEDAKNLGAYYVLTALTLVSVDAALAMPWLFEAASATGP